MKIVITKSNKKKTIEGSGADHKIWGDIDSPADEAWLKKMHQMFPHLKLKKPETKEIS